MSYHIVTNDNFFFQKSPSSTSMDDTDDTNSIDGDNVEENFFSDPFFYDPVLPAGAKVAFDVQGAAVKIIMFVLFYALGCY